jgi:ABC-type multidrug transport system ATPase subunit
MKKGNALAYSFMKKDVLEVEDTEISLGLFSVYIQSLYLKKGQLTFLKGISGSGKTTILKAIAGVIPSAILLNINAIFDSIGFIMHEPTMLPWRSLHENITCESRLRKKRFKWDTFKQDIENVGLPSNILGTLAGRLSQGMRQRVEILKAISFECDLIVCDEAFSGIDISARYSIMERINNYIENGRGTLIATSHTESDLLRLADRVVVVNNGIASEKLNDFSYSRGYRIKMSSDQLISMPECYLLNEL